MPIRRSLTPNDSWETTLSWILVERSLGMAGGPVSIVISLFHFLNEKVDRTDLPLSFFVGPGIHIAQASLWIACAMSLAVFDIGKYVDESGNVVEPETRYTSGGVLR